MACRDACNKGYTKLFEALGRDISGYKLKATQLFEPLGQDILYLDLDLTVLT